MAFASGATMGSSESKQSRLSERSTYESALACDLNSESEFSVTSATSKVQIHHGEVQNHGKYRRRLSSLRRSLSGGSLALDQTTREDVLPAEKGVPPLDDVPQSIHEWPARQKGKMQGRNAGYGGVTCGRDRPASPNSVLLEALALESGSTSFDSSEGDPSGFDVPQQRVLSNAADPGRMLLSYRDVYHRRRELAEGLPKRHTGPVAGKELVQLLQQYLEQNPDRVDTEGGVSSGECESPALQDDTSEPSPSSSNREVELPEVKGTRALLMERVVSEAEGAGCSTVKGNGRKGRTEEAGHQRSDLTSRRHASVIPKGTEPSTPNEKREWAPNRRHSCSGERSDRYFMRGDGNGNRILLQAGAAALFTGSSRRVSRSSERAGEETESEIEHSGLLSGSMPRSLSLSLGKGTKSPVVACSIPYRELEAATDNFAYCNLLGNGGFGPVHKGLLGGFVPVAVKQLRHGSSQGDDEFRAEVEVLGRLRHKNVVPLVGYCVAEEKRLLVYEFAQHGCLHRTLHEPGQPPLDWHTRWRIAVGIANGICYLHSGCAFGKVVHLDIRSSNILLQKNYSPMVADFGLARFVTGKASDFVSHVKGTFGYIDPEYATTGCLTEKSDVYAYGVVLLELLSGRKALDTKYPAKEQCLVHWANKLMARKLYSKLADPRLGGHFSQRQFKRMVDVVSQCVQPKGIDRPTMRQALNYFETGHWEVDTLQRSAPQPDMTWAFRASPLLSFRRTNSVA